MAASSPYNLPHPHGSPHPHLGYPTQQQPSYMPATFPVADNMAQTYPEGTHSAFIPVSQVEGMVPGYPETPGFLASSFPQMTDFATPPSNLKEKSASVGSLDFGGLQLPPDDDFDENSRKEMEILNMNRVKLTEYVHDCTALHPFMKEKKVFTVQDCELIQHEVTGAQKMDKFVDIVLTKGPKAVGVFHEALGKSYPYVFDMLTRIFNGAGIQLPESRQITEDPAETCSDSTPPDKTGTVIRKSSVRKTIIKHIDELTERCEVVKNQRDELQKALLQRERDINNLLSHRDQQIHQKYEDMLSLLANWREIMTHQSDGSIQKMQELLSEQEGIRQDYELLEGDYLLVVSELSAARDRISKLLTHLQKMETEFSLAQEEKDSLKDKLEVQQGEIQRLYRRFERIGKDPNDRSSSLERDIDKRKSKTLLEKAQEDKIKELEEKIKVCQIERKYALEEKDNIQLKYYEERERRKKAEDELKSTRRQLRHSQSEPAYTMEKIGKFSDDVFSTKKPQPLVEDTIFMPADNSGMEIGLAVVVRELSETGNALKHGVRVGDEIHQVNKIKISYKDEPLQFVQRLLAGASQTVTLSIKRQPSPGSNTSSTSPQSQLHTPLGVTQSLSSQGTGTSSMFSSLVSRQLSPLPSPRPRPYELIPHLSNPHGALSSLKSRDPTSDESTEDSDGNYGVCSEPEIEYRISETSIDQSEGIVMSPRNSKHYYDPLNDFRDGESRFSRNKWTLTGAVLPEPGANILTPDGEKTLNEEGENPPERRRVHRDAIRKPRKRSKRKKNAENVPRLSHSVDDLDLISPQSELTSGEFNCCKKDGSRCVLLPSGQLGSGLFLIGGRGNGLYIRSERTTSRSLKTGDQILQICGRPTVKMTYAEAIELMNKFNTVGKQCLLQVKYDREGYEKLDPYSRDNFYVKAKVDHKLRLRAELSFEKGDVFHVTDTMPADSANMWRVEKLNSRGEIIGAGCIPTSLEQTDYPSPSSSNSLPMSARNKGPRMIDHMTLQNPSHLGKHSPPPARKQVTAQSAFRLYLPVNKVHVTEPRPLVVMGVFDEELREYLVERGFKDGLKFAFPSREPAEKLTSVSEDKIVESISVSDGILHSTIEDVQSVTREGYHCMLTLTTSDIHKPKIRALHPIIIGLTPHGKTIRVKPSGGRLPAGFTQEVLTQPTISMIKDKIRKIQVFMTGEIEVSSPFNVEDLVVHICNLVTEQQKNIVWEADH